MKYKILLLVAAATFAFVFIISCEKSSKEANIEETNYFLSQIRPIFFENVNFDSPEVVKNIPKFKEDFYITFNKLEKDFNNGLFKTTEDIHYFRLSSQYYGFYLTGLVAAYLDGNLSFKQIVGNKAIGVFSGLESTSKDFEKQEMQAMSARSKAITQKAANINGVYDEKSYGFYLLCNQVETRLTSGNDKSSPEAHKMITNFSGQVLTKLDYVPVWNVLMSQVFMTNYDDSLNTFENPKLDYLLSNIQSRLYPGSLPDLGGKYPEIVGPIYRFDLLLKKIDWLLKKKTITNTDVETVELYLVAMQTIINYLETDKKTLLETWPYYNTLAARKEKLTQMKNYIKNSSTGVKPALKAFFNSKEFNKAYQCYSCHKNSGL